MSEQLAQVVLEALESEEPNVLRGACIMAGRLGLAEAERGLLKALSHKAWQVQAEAARALGLLASQGARPFLRRLLGASEANLRALVLSAAAGKPAGDSAEVPPQVQREAAVALGRIDPELAQSALLSALASDDPKLLGAALAGLANLEAAAGRQRIIELLAHSAPEVRRAAATALGKLREPAALDGLLALLGDDDAEVRKEAVIALNAIKDAKAIEPLKGMLADPQDEVRRVAAIALGNTGKADETLVQALVAGLSDQGPLVRAACISALGNLKASQALEAVAAPLHDRNNKVAQQAGATVASLHAAAQRGAY